MTARDGRMVPLTQYDQDLVNALDQFHAYVVYPKKSRSSKENAFYRSVLRVAWANTHLQDAYPNPEKLHKALLVELGYFDWIKKLDGEVLGVLDSTAFSKMDGVKFKEFMDQAFHLLAEEIGCDPVELLDVTKDSQLEN